LPPVPDRTLNAFGQVFLLTRRVRGARPAFLNPPYDFAIGVCATARRGVSMSVVPALLLLIIIRTHLQGAGSTTRAATR